MLVSSRVGTKPKEVNPNKVRHKKLKQKQTKHKAQETNNKLNGLEH